MKKSIAITTIISIHAAIIGVLLIQAGCSSTNEETAKVPSAQTSTEEVTTIKSDNATVAEPTIKEGDPSLRANPTKPTYPMNNVAIEDTNDTVAPKDSLNDDEVVKPIQTAKTTNAQEDKQTTVYVVKKGDSISKIAAKFKVSQSKILKLNSIKKANSIRIGQKLKIPASKSAVAEENVASEKTEAPVTDANATVYVVKKGDSLSKIAYKNGMTVSQLMKMNNLKNANIRIGQKLSVKKLDSKESANIAKAEENKNLKDGEVVHKVKSGEVLGLIASKYSVKIADLKKRNNISDASKIRVGQTIIIPASASKKVAPPTAPKKVEPVAKAEPKVEKPVEANVQPVVEPQAPVVVPETIKIDSPVVQPAQPAEESVPVTTIR